MQNAKDSFYIALRDQLAVVNPERVITLRAVQRPGIMVEDAEAPQAQLANDVFVIRWSEQSIDAQLPSILVQMTCLICYGSSGSQQNSGLDRGRALAAMDSEMLAMLSPLQVMKMNYAVTPALPMHTQVFWSEPDFKPLETQRDQLIRKVAVKVFEFQEQGE